jgi:hypothetical protein
MIADHLITPPALVIYMACYLGGALLVYALLRVVPTQIKRSEPVFVHV